MTRVFESKKVCATMFILFAMAVAANSFAGGSLPSFGTSPVLAPDIQHTVVAGDPFFGPDTFDDDGAPSALSV
jgi:hypothetical protein